MLVCCSDKVKERSSIKVRKKVSFNLNVQTYEPVPHEEDARCYSPENNKDELQEKNNAKGSTGFFPIHHRYHDCVDSYDDDEDYIESDLDYDDEDEDLDFDGCDDLDYDQVLGQEELTKQAHSQSKESQPRNNSADGELKSVESNANVRDRSQYISSVLNPVENLTQWKALKARALPANKLLRKENAAVEELIPSVPISTASNYNQSIPLLQEIAVDSSLSNWLVSRDGIKNNIPLKRSVCDRSCSQESKENRVVLDITNLKA